MEFSASCHGAGGPDADEDDLLEPELAVLDLGDVLELGAQPDHAPQGVPLGEVLLTGGELVLGDLLGIGPVGRDQLDRVVVVPVVGGVEGRRRG